MSRNLNSRKGDWFLTRSGIQFWPLDPRPEDIDIADIAHGLSHVCRFGGHCKRFYSVAQHSVLVARHLPPALQFQGLMHDAGEAYLGDVVRPLKYSLPQYLEAEEKVWSAICRRFGLAPRLHAAVKEADNRALMTERRDIMPDAPFKWAPSLEAIPPFETRVRANWFTRTHARQTFLKEFARLYSY